MGKISRLTLILNIQKVPFSNVWILSLNETVTTGHHEARRRPLSRYIFHKLASKNENEKSRDEFKKKKAPGPGKVSILVIIFTSKSRNESLCHEPYPEE